jgi:hypothetical protein
MGALFRNLDISLALLGIERPKDCRVTAGLVAMRIGAFILSLGPSLYCYLLQVFGRRAKSQTARVRLQILWLDAQQHPLNPSPTCIRIVDVNDRWQSARDEFLAPSESHYAKSTPLRKLTLRGSTIIRFPSSLLDCEPILSAVPNPAA